MTSESFSLSNKNENQIGLQLYQHNASQQSSNFSTHVQGHPGEHNFHQKQSHTFKRRHLKILRKQINIYIRNMYKKHKFNIMYQVNTNHMHCISCRLLCCSPSFVNNTAVFSASGTYQKHIPCESKIRKDQRKIIYSV